MAEFNLSIGHTPERRRLDGVIGGDWGEFEEPLTALRSGDVVVQAAFTAKTARGPGAPADTDPSSVQIVITPGESAAGVVEPVIGNPSAAWMRFRFTPAETTKLLSTPFADVQAWVARDGLTPFRTVLELDVAGDVGITTLDTVGVDNSPAEIDVTPKVGNIAPNAVVVFTAVERNAAHQNIAPQPPETGYTWRVGTVAGSPPVFTPNAAFGTIDADGTFHAAANPPAGNFAVEAARDSLAGTGGGTVPATPVGEVLWLDAAFNPIAGPAVALVQGAAATRVYALVRSAAHAPLVGRVATANDPNEARFTRAPAGGNSDVNGRVAFDLTPGAVGAAANLIATSEGIDSAPLAVSVVASGVAEYQRFLDDPNVGAGRLRMLKTYAAVASRIAGSDAAHSGGLHDTVPGTATGDWVQATAALQPTIEEAPASGPTPQATFAADDKMGMPGFALAAGDQADGDATVTGHGYFVAFVLEAKAAALYLLNYGPFIFNKSGGNIGSLQPGGVSATPCADGVRRCIMFRRRWDGAALNTWVDEWKLLGEAAWRKTNAGAGPGAVTGAGSINESSVGGGNGGALGIVAALGFTGNAPATDEASVAPWAHAHGVTDTAP